ncbi:hypothetical protein OW491_00930 [Neptunomonas sp. CHC150]|uniref:hypothetical protein n=1 Tax=Neptunomonas sp. CHC150 TaxID=2998324 RepID=UPI0025B13FC0|nr:hypothetical protein [Neptunomonas sp. CHC150]MDN2658358.1 hypothetical protein [Neptunomonas sp. CHC150]
MKPVLLNHIPESGSIEEVRFDAIGDCTWIKFQDSNYLDWVGVFGMGWGGGDDVIQIGHNVVFVLSNGQGYFIDVNERKLLCKTECDYLKSIIQADPDTVIAATDTEVYVYNINGLVFATKRIASDGINLKSFASGIVIGEVWGIDKWYPFSLNIENQHHKCSWSCTW